MRFQVGFGARVKPGLLRHGFILAAKHAIVLIEQVDGQPTCAPEHQEPRGEQRLGPLAERRFQALPIVHLAVQERKSGVVFAD